MEIWELALIILTITYMVINMTYLIIVVITMSKMGRMIFKSCKIVEKMIDKSNSLIDEVYKDEN